MLPPGLAGNTYKGMRLKKGIERCGAMTSDIGDMSNVLMSDPGGRPVISFMTVIIGGNRNQTICIYSVTTSFVALTPAFNLSKAFDILSNPSPTTCGLGLAKYDPFSKAFSKNPP